MLLVVGHSIGNVATPEPGPTQLVSPNQNPGDAQFFLFFLFSVLLNFLLVKLS